MWLKWLPWRMIVRSTARKRGFLDPIDIFSKLERFAQPAEVAAPVQLLRSGVVLHARGLMNSQAIQHNLDWVWPYWVECQFDPHHQSFVPRAFSITHINLTQRNWTAVGIPDCEEFPIVDPRGLVTPFFDGWSLDSWIIDKSGKHLIPSRLPIVSQTLSFDEGLCITTEAADNDRCLISKVFVKGTLEAPLCRIELKGSSSLSDSFLVVALRPYNPEGVSFIHDIDLLDNDKGWKVNNSQVVHLDRVFDQHAFSYYRKGDVFHRLPCSDKDRRMTCNIGLATAAAQFKLLAHQSQEVVVEIPLFKSQKQKKSTFKDLLYESALARAFHEADHSVLKEGQVVQQTSVERWKESLEGVCQLEIPDDRFQFIFDAAVRTLILHSPNEVYPGPYTYKRFWFRDAAFILHAMLCLGLKSRVRRVMDGFSSKQTSGGYFLSQDGEWDSNGEALWIIEKYCQMTGEPLPQDWRRSIDLGGRWIMHKRLKGKSTSSHKGLFPPGFSAEHLGPNDYYYWDDFWGVAGLNAVAHLIEEFWSEKRAQHFYQESKDFMTSIEASLDKVQKRLKSSIIPASPYRRMDAGAIGSVAVDYPLMLWPAHDIRVKNTVHFLMEHCFVDGGFFQDMTHSGINPYLTLHIAQVLLRNGDVRCFDLMKTVARLASPTGQWPEAIHPHTKGGCMGDGQHVWAASEWVLMIRNCFVREEEKDKKLILCSGVAKEWIDKKKKMSFGPATTVYGVIDISIIPLEDKIKVSWKGQWFKEAPSIEIRLPGFKKVIPKAGDDEVYLSLEGK